MTGLLLLGCRALILTVFAAAFAGKARSAARFRGFAGSIRQLAVLPQRAAAPAGALVVAGEGTVAVLLAMPSGVRAGFALASVLLAVFIGIAVRAVRGGVFAECRCFGSKGSVMGQAMIVRNLLLLAAALPGAAAGAPVPAGRAAAALAAAAAGALGAWVFTRWYDRIVAALMKRLLAPARTAG
ncbi:methylamine utilization protein MauE [Actinomadura sp. LD22]|uniref:Methylamine utilization protein MauE n=1 Tax=Actinomadura physcomitrii TaxID=2650748 RepID=A0A6I4MPU2_9ACTN|nr:MauE/DoxX family redox-associated membrane protein [Actinomadura physcomitrii]MWA05887.1 methylamine utilization protein MauE [Actinomadura physcomitrii]